MTNSSLDTLQQTEMEVKDYVPCDQSEIATLTFQNKNKVQSLVKL